MDSCYSKALDYFRSLLDTTPKDKWETESVPATFVWAKENGVYTIGNYQTLKGLLIRELAARLPVSNKEVSEILGLDVLKIEKTGDNYTVYTSKGEFTMPGDNLHSRLNFAKAVFLALFIVLPDISAKDWKKVLAYFSTIIVRVDEKEVSEETVIEDALSQFLSNADERILAFVSRGLPVIYDGAFCFRLSDVLSLVRKNFDFKITRPQLVKYLKSAGFESKKSDQLRYWSIPTDKYGA